MSDLGDFWIHTVTVETFQGAGPAGDTFAAPATVTGFLEGKTQLVRNANGEQVVSSSTFYTATGNAALFTADSRLTPTGGRAARVIAVNTNDSGNLMLPDHVAINLT